MLCISLFENKISTLVKKVGQHILDAQLMEIRVDALYSREFELLPRHVESIMEAAGSKVRLLFTNRSRLEGGAFMGEDTERLAWLKICVEQGADLVDVELNSPPFLRDELLHHAKKRGVQTVVSYHDLNGTPPIEELEDIFHAALALGPAIIKIVTTPNTPDDLVRIMGLYPHAGTHDARLIAFAMGETGRLTRLMSLYLGAPFTYCAPAGRQGTAPGQLDINTATEILKLLSTPSS